MAGYAARRRNPASCADFRYHHRRIRSICPGQPGRRIAAGDCLPLGRVLVVDDSLSESVEAKRHAETGAITQTKQRWLNGRFRVGQQTSRKRGNKFLRCGAKRPMSTFVDREPTVIIVFFCIHASYSLHSVAEWNAATRRPRHTA